MSRNLAKILRTEITAEMPLKAMARAIQAKGRGRDTVLAHITPKEAKKLKAMGGRGSINPETGLPEFQEDDFLYKAMLPPTIAAPNIENEFHSYVYPANPNAIYPDADAFGVGLGEPSDPYPDASAFGVGVGTASDPSSPFASIAYNIDAGGGPPTREQFASYPSYIRALYPGGQLPPTGMSTVYGPGTYAGETSVKLTPATETPKAEPGFMEKLRGELGRTLNSPIALAALGLGGVGLLSNIQRSRAAQRQGRQLRQEQEQLAAPYRAAGQEAVARAQRGELTAPGQQAFQRAQAQQAQQAARLGGVGAQQAATQIEAFRQQLINQQMDYGLKLSGIADQIVVGAIRTGIEADREARQASQQFFGTMMQAMGSVGRGR